MIKFLKILHKILVCWADHINFIMYLYFMMRWIYEIHRRDYTTLLFLLAFNKFTWFYPVLWTCLQFHTYFLPTRADVLDELVFLFLFIIMCVNFVMCFVMYGGHCRSTNRLEFLHDFVGTGKCFCNRTSSRHQLPIHSIKKSDAEENYS